MKGDDDEDMHTLRCTNVVGEHDYAFGWRLCTSRRPSEETIQDRVYAVFIAAYDYVDEYAITLNPRLRYGRLQVRTRLRLMQLGGESKAQGWYSFEPCGRVSYTSRVCRHEKLENEPS